MPRRFACIFLSRWALMALLLIAPCLTFAETQITGTVTDPVSHLPVAGAAVTAEGGNARAVTDEAGRFTLRSDGTVTRIIVTRVGYQRLAVAVGDASQPLAIELQPAPLPQPPTEVTGRALASPDLDLSRTTAVLQPRDLNRASGLDLESSINTLPGVIMRSRTPYGGAHVQIRGYYPNFSQNFNGFGYQAFLEDIPVTDATGSTILDDVDFATLGRVEVIKGPNSSRFGAPIAGVVDFHTLRPAAGLSVSQQGVGGSDGLFRTNTTLADGGEHSQIVVNYGHQTYDSFRPSSRSKKDYAQFTGDFEAGPRQKLSAYFSYNNSFEQLAGEIDSSDFYARQAIDNPAYTAQRSRVSIESSRVGFTHDVRFDDRFDLRSTLFGTAQTMQQPFAHGFSNTNRFSLGARSALGVNAKIANTPLDGAVGAFVQRTNATVNGFFIPANRPSDQENYGLNTFAFTEWNAHLPKDVVLTAGVNVNVYEFGIRNMLRNNLISDSTKTLRRRFDPQFSPRGALLKRFGDELSLYGSISRGFTPPSLSSFINSDNTVNEDLRPEKVLQFEGGAKGLLLEGRLTYDVAWFDLEITDKLVSQRIGLVNTTTNVGKQRNRGIEASLSHLLYTSADGPIRNVRPWLSYTFTDARYLSFKSDNNDNASTVDFSGKRVARIPRNVYNLGLDAESKGGGYLFASLQHVDEIFVTFGNTNRLKAYNLLAAKLGCRRRLGPFDLDVSAGGDNLLGDTYYKFAFVGPDYLRLVQPKDGGSGDGYILPGPYDATLFGGARLSWNF